jgi:hypothetical protein
MLNISDPLALLAIESGQVPNPSRQEGAAGSSRLDVAQRSIDFGEAVPIVFGRRRNDKGGILISPGATECRFENDEANAVTAYYHLVLSEGRLDSIEVRDVFQKSCRVGTHTQTYNRRAGTWLPGNFIVQREDLPLPEATFICGSLGLYPDITTVSFQITIPSGFNQWDRQVHFFIRGGMHVDRLLTNDNGPSDNFADLVRWMLVKADRIPLPLIDVEQLQATALFLEVNNFTCNAWIQQATNYSDFIGKWAPYFLLIASNRSGKKGLRPVLPTNQDGTIKTDPIDIEYTFTENLIIPGTFEVEYANFADRQPFVAQMTWRQELGNEAAIIRTAEVRIPGTAAAGPYESHDLSEFCTNEDHAAKVGSYIVADRFYTTHSIRFAPRPQLHSTLLKVGSIIRVALERDTPNTQPCRHDYLYQIQRISKTFSGETQYECRHFPVDAQRRSIVALNVASAQGTGITLTTQTSGVSCDINSSSDTSVPTESFLVPGDFGTNDPDFGFGVAEFGGAEVDGLPEFALEDFGGGGGTIGDEGFGGGGGDGGGDGNGSDGGDATPLGPLQNRRVVDGQILFDAPEDACVDPEITVITAELDENDNVIPGSEKEITGFGTVAIWGVDEGEFLTPTGDPGYWTFVAKCPNNEEQYTDPVIRPTAPPFDPTEYEYYRFVGPNGGTSSWRVVNANNPPGMKTSSGMGNTRCTVCGVEYSPAPSTFTPWCADARSSVAGPYTAVSRYCSVRSQESGGIIFYQPEWSYTTATNVNCSTNPVCGSGNGGGSGSWEFTDDLNQEEAQASWAGTDSGYEELSTPVPNP